MKKSDYKCYSNGSITETPEIMTTSDILKYLSISMSTFLNLRKNDSRFPRPIMLGKFTDGRSIRWRKKDIDAYLSALI